MKRNRRTLRNHFLRRIKTLKENHIQEINRIHAHLNSHRVSLEKARNLNIALDVENSLLKERITALKTKKWYQYVAISWSDILPKENIVTNLQNKEGLIQPIDSEIINSLIK